MLEEVPGNARKIVSVILKNGKGTIVSPELIQSISPDKTVSSNDMTAIRRAIPFVSEKPIVQERVDGVRQRVFRSIGENEYEDYQFTERNFFSLQQEEIDKIQNRLLEVNPDFPKKEILRYLTICDMLVQTGARGTYVKVKRRPMACSINIPDDKLIDYLDFLAKAGIISLLKNTALFNTEFSDISDVADTVELLDKNSTMKVLDDGFDAAFSMNTDMVSFLKTVQKTLREDEKRIDDLRTESIKLREQLNNLQSQAENFPLLLEQYQKLMKKSTDQEEKLKKNRQLAKSMREYRSLVMGRKETVFANLSQKMTEAIMQYQRDHKDAFFMSKMTGLVADASKSMEIALNARK